MRGSFINPFDRSRMSAACLALIGLALVLAASSGAPAEPPALAAAAASVPTQVRVMRLPDGGIQPEVAVDEAGTVHVVYFTGDPRAGDLMYMKSADGGTTFTQPLRVNSIASSAVAIGSVRGSQLALGRDGRVHVAWNGSQAVNVKTEAGDDEHRSPLLYTRLKDDGSGFEPERNVIQKQFGLDGGAAVAADANGHVYVVWHAPRGGREGEQHRTIWVTKSSDDGATFAAESEAGARDVGCCACCGASAFCDKGGSLHILYRSAHQVVHRDMWLLSSDDGGGSFRSRKVAEWNVGQCVMSTSAFCQRSEGEVWAAWETRQRVHCGSIAASEREAAPSAAIKTIAPEAQGENAKHPVLAGNARGQMLLAWTEGTSWNKGGRVAWQIFDADGRQMLAENGRGDDLPVWGLIAAFATCEGEFVIVY